MNKYVNNWLKKHLKGMLAEALVKNSVNVETKYDYLSSISIKDKNSEFAQLGSVSEYTDGDVHSDIFSAFPDVKNSIQKYIDRDDAKLPATVDRELYHGERHYDWWLSGLLDYLKISKMLEKHGQPLTDGGAFYEMGCASGRVLRHFSAQRPGIDVWGSDINNRHIRWIQENLSQDIKIFQNTILPQLPLESNSIDIACAFSVFTHIDDLDTAWLCEMRRVLKKGGIFYVTIHSDDTWMAMTPDDQIYQSLLTMASNISEYKITPNFLAGPLPKEKTVFSWNANNYNTNVFHTKAHVKKEWGRFFKILEIVRCGSQYQDVVILQKP